MLSDLADIADGFLSHNRDILRRIDGSSIRSGGRMLRRIRDYVPDTLSLPSGLRDIPLLLALGTDAENTFCPAHGNEAMLSQHFGDLGGGGIKQQ